MSEDRIQRKIEHLTGIIRLARATLNDAERELANVAAAVWDALDGAPEPEGSKDAAALVQVRRYLERFNPGGTHAQDEMAQALENILDGAQVAWSPSDDERLPVEGESKS